MSRDAMKMLINIIIGWWFWITNRNNKLAKSRLKICAGCEFRKGLICQSCGCVLQAKARLFDEHCPEFKWKQGIPKEVWDTNKLFHK